MNETATASWGNWCRHYNSLMNDTCNAGVNYLSVKHPTEPMGYPCFKNRGCTDRCSLASFPTPEEIKQHNEEMDAILSEFLHKIADNICPHCNQHIQEKKQVGRCVYAWPCNHRLYQGTLPKKQFTIADHPYFKEQMEQEKRERP